MGRACILRATLVVSVALAMWTIASPAFAAAPFCDDRGASAIAPPPVLVPSDAIFERAAACPPAREISPFATLTPSRTRASVAVSQAEPASLCSRVALDAPAEAHIDYFTILVDGLRRGMRWRVDRPPRI